MGDWLDVEIEEAPIGAVAALEQVPISFIVERIYELRLSPDAPGGVALVERRVEAPYVKAYDIPGERPSDWASQFDLSNWGLFLARTGGRIVGGAAVAFDTASVHMLEGRRDLAVLWNIRVEPDNRQHGIGSRLFRAAERWARRKGCRELKVETQNVNVPACRFYSRHGCALVVARPGVYDTHPDETQLIWSRYLTTDEDTSTAATTVAPKT